MRQASQLTQFISGGTCWIVAKKKEPRRDLAEPRRQILGFRATEVAGTSEVWYKKEENYTKKENHKSAYY